MGAAGKPSRATGQAALLSAALSTALCAALCAALCVALLLASPASAHWSAAGSGVGAGTTGTLAAPTGVSVPANSLPGVPVTWTASSGSPAPTGYYVTRTAGGLTAAACASSASTLLTGTSCTDSEVADGAYTYSVTAVFRSWSAASAPSGSVGVWTPANVAFTGQPGTTVAGTAINPAVTVTVQTATGVAVPLAGRSITVALGSNPGGGTLSGNASANTDAAGVATFADLSLDKAGVGYTLGGASTGLTGATSAAFTVTAATADRFAITSAAVAGTAATIATLGPITVAIRDAFGNAVDAPTGGTVVSLASNSAGTARFSPISGGATTTTVTIPAGWPSTTFFYGDTKAGEPTITVSGTLAGASQPATINAGAPSQFAITSTAIAAGAASISATLGPLTVQRQDLLGNPVDPASTETVTLTSNSLGTARFAPTLGGATTTTVTIPSGQSSVNFYYGDTKPGSSTITASGALTSGTQAQTIVVGPAYKVVITSGSIAGVASATAVRGPIALQVRDIADNPVTTGAVVALSSTSAGTAIFAATSGGTGVNSVTISPGQSGVDFYYGDTKATGAGTVTVTAAVAGLTSATQNGAITPDVPTHLEFGQQPTNTNKGSTITPAITARILDQFDNLTSSTAPIEIAIDHNAGSFLGLGAGILSGTTTRSAVAGVATFNNLSINGFLGIGGTGTGYTLKVTRASGTPALSPRTSNPFNIT